MDESSPIKMPSDTKDDMLAELRGPELDHIPHIRDLILEAVELNPGGEAIVSLHQSPLQLPGLDKSHECSNLRWTYQMLKSGALHLSVRRRRLKCI